MKGVEESVLRTGEGRGAGRGGEGREGGYFLPTARWRVLLISCEVEWIGPAFMPPPCPSPALPTSPSRPPPSLPSQISYPLPCAGG